MEEAGGAGNREGSSGAEVGRRSEGAGGAGDTWEIGMDVGVRAFLDPLERGRLTPKKSS